MQEAENASSVIDASNTEIYSTLDPLEMDNRNPNRKAKLDG